MIISTHKRNLFKLLEEIAQKELVQEPAFIIKCSKLILKSIAEREKSEALEKILAELQSKARSLTKFIQFPKAMSPAERTTSSYGTSQAQTFSC